MRLTFLCVAATPGLRRGVFPADERLDERGLAATRECAKRLPRTAACWTSPAASAAETVAALGATARSAEALRECDYGQWVGLDLRAVSTRHPNDYAAWLADPEAAPHGGESFGHVIGRVGTWLDALAPTPEETLAVTHASVIRAAVIHARALPFTEYARISVAPLTLTAMRRDGGAWIVESVSVSFQA